MSEIIKIGLAGALRLISPQPRAVEEEPWAPWGYRRERKELGKRHQEFLELLQRAQEWFFVENEDFHSLFF